ncbi:MAG: hypothetical protein PUG04_06385 [Lachnospiraceae bacterium]|nr:hypothetical protein [Lachnospiraceae bacterium]
MSDTDDKDDKLTAAGFIFSNEMIAEKAKKEMNAVAYLRTELSDMDGIHLLRTYKELIDKEVFDTAEGYSFLKDIQQQLIADDSVDNTEIPPILVYDASEVRHHQIEMEEPVWKGRFRGLVIVTIALAACVAFMFVLTATQDSPNIINYKEKLENHYSEWDESLTKREKQVREKEEKLLEKENSTNTTDEGSAYGSK